TEAMLRLQNVQSRLNDLQELLPPGAALPDISAQAPQAALLEMPRIIAAGKARLMLIRDEAKRDQAIEALRLVVHDLKRVDTGHPEGPGGSTRDFFIHHIVQRLPRFVFFSDGLDILPFKVSIDEIEKNQAVQNLSFIAKLDFKKALLIEDIQQRINTFEAHAGIIRDDFFGRWGQHRIELVARPEGNTLLFGVREEGDAEFFKVEQRSKGFQWFLSFYLKLQGLQSGNVIVLVDEQGINLHPAAQKDILN